MADIDDDSGNTLNKKIRSAQLAQYNYIFGKDLVWDILSQDTLYFYRALYNILFQISLIVRQVYSSHTQW